MARAAYQQQAGQSADRAGQRQGTDDDPLHLDAHIAGCPLTLTDDGDLIAVFAALHVDVDHNGQRQYDEDVEQIFVIADLGKPAGLGGLVDDSDLARSFRNFPYDRIEGDQLDGHVVHHEGEQRLVSPPFCFKESRDQCPDGTGRNGGNGHDKDQQSVRNLISQKDHAGCACQAADQDLPLSSQVPETHPKSRRQGK